MGENPRNKSMQVHNQQSNCKVTWAQCTTPADWEELQLAEIPYYSTTVTGKKQQQQQKKNL